MNNNTARRQGSEPGSKHSDSRDLVRRIMSGDQAAEGEAWTRYLDKIRRVAWRYSNCEDDVNDRVSATWEIALPKLRAGELINPDALGAFLCGIARSVSLGELRKRPWLTISGDMQYLEQTLVETHTPFEALHGEQRMRSTLALIEELPVKRDQEMIVLEFFEQKSRDHMCAEYGVTPLQLSRWISRARKRLQDKAQSHASSADQHV